MYKHRLALIDVIAAIRANPSITAAQATAIIERYFPEHGAEYAEWYIEWFYKCGILTANTFAALKNRIGAMDATQYEFARKRMVWIGIEGARRKLAQMEKQAQIAADEAAIAEFELKTIPDQETLDFYNTHNDFAVRNSLLELDILRLQAELEDLEEN